MRLEKAHGQPMSAPSWLGESALLDTNRLALVIGNSSYPDADSPLPQITRDAEGLDKCSSQERLPSGRR
jgi:hypothetical protein